jgi:hypothetical protein
MEFDTTLDNPYAGTNSNSNSDLLLTITSSVGTGTTLTKSYTYDHTSGDRIGSSRFRMIMKLNSLLLVIITDKRLTEYQEA